MIHYLKAMLLAAVVVSAFGVQTTATQATTFTDPGLETTLKPAKDGTGKTSHHVFIIGNAGGTSTVSFTCEEITGPGHIIGPESSEVTITPAYSGCTTAGQAVTVTNTGCLFKFTANGEVHVANDESKVCKHGAGNSPIDIAFTNCNVEVGAQTLKGIKYTQVGQTVTVEPSVTGITYNSEGAACPYGTTSNGTYKTGNTIVSGERGGVAVEVKWDA